MKKKDKKGIELSVGKDSRSKSTRGNNSYVFDLVDALSAPIITFSTLWADTIPKRILDIIPLARMKALAQKEKQATDPEIVAYIYTRALEAPLNGDWVEIYCYITCKVMEKWFCKDYWDAVHSPRKLNADQNRELDALRRFIFYKRRDILKKRLKDEKKNVNNHD